MSGTMIRASPMPMASGERRRTVFLSPTVVRLETDWRHRTDSPCRGPFGFRRALHGGNDRLSIIRAGGGIRTRTPLRAADFLRHLLDVHGLSVRSGPCSETSIEGCVRT